MCEGNLENEWPVFIDCHHAEAIWGACGLFDDVKQAMNVAESFRQCLFNLIQTLAATKVDKLVMMIWAIWGRRNAKVWDGVMEPLGVAVNKAVDVLHE